jgi:hypothetical protein
MVMERFDACIFVHGRRSEHFGFVNPTKAGNRGWNNNSGSGNYGNGLHLKSPEIFSSSFSSSRSLYS